MLFVDFYGVLYIMYMFVPATRERTTAVLTTERVSTAVNSQGSLNENLFRHKYFL